MAVYFQTLDDKSECVGIYHDKDLLFHFENLPGTASRTWKYVPWLNGYDIEYASLYLEGQSINDHIPEYLKEDWEDVSKKVVAFKRSLGISQVDTNENCFYDLVPKRFLIDFCEVQNQITQHIFDNTQKPRRYEFNKHLSMMLGDIASRTIKINKPYLKAFGVNHKLAGQVGTVCKSSMMVSYKQFGTKTGRLTTNPLSFPILTLSKDLRPAVQPNHDLYVEIDFNGAEVRTLLGLLGKEQPNIDVHNFHLKKIFTGLKTRSEAKTAFFAWLYGSSSESLRGPAIALNKYYNKSALLEKYWQNGQVTTPFHRTIKDVDSHHALNYLVQSTAADLALKQFMKVKYFLDKNGCGSEVAFLIHDSIVLDLKKSDLELLPTIEHLLSSTTWGHFPVTTNIGTNLGNLKRWQHG